MSRIEHVACGYSEYAPGCDDSGCLVHRIDFAERKGWSIDSLQHRLDARLDDELSALFGTTDAVGVLDVREGRAR